VIDDKELEGIRSASSPMKHQVASGQYGAAFTTVERTFCYMLNYTHGIDFYNFLEFSGKDCPISDIRTYNQPVPSGK